jgi:hypothetical protein
MLDEIVCTAIRTSSPCGVTPAGRGTNHGMAVADEIVIDGRNAVPPESIRTEVAQLAAIISASSDPIQTIGVFQKFLLEELTNLLRSQRNREGEKY